MKESPHYQDGEFKNLVPTSQTVEGSSLASNVWKHLFNEKDRPAPSEPLPAIKTDIKNLPIDQDVVVWMGHSSYYIQIGGKRILLDPILSSYAAPVSFANQAFLGTTIYTSEDFRRLIIC